MVSTEKPISILREIRDYIIPLADDELCQLEKNILSEGCREPLVVWAKDNELVLVDGHNRYKICQKHNLPFKIRKMFFGDLDEVKVWMVDNQIGRRNLTHDQMSYYRGLKYLSVKRRKGGYENVKSSGKNELSTSEFLANHFNVSESTIKRDAQFAQGLNLIGKSNAKLKMKILTGEAKVKKADIQILSRTKHVDRLVIKNEADLYNKAKLLREEALDEVENKVKTFERERIQRAQEILKTHEPIFAKKEDKLKRIKGMILSAINLAIKEKDARSIKDLRKLVDQLEDLLFDE